MTLKSWLDHNARQKTPDPADTVEWPEIQVTEEPMTDEAWRKWEEENNLKPLELLP